MKVREELRNRLKKELGKAKNLEILMNLVRQKTRKKRDYLKQKYKEKLSFLEDIRVKELEEIRRKELPSELEEYSKSYAFNMERFAKLEIQADPEVTIGDVKVDEDKKSVLMLNPKFAALKRLDREAVENEIEVGQCKLDMNGDKKRKIKDRKKQSTNRVMVKDKKQREKRTWKQ